MSASPPPTPGRSDPAPEPPSTAGAPGRAPSPVRATADPAPPRPRLASAAARLAAGGLVLALAGCAALGAGKSRPDGGGDGDGTPPAAGRDTAPAAGAVARADTTAQAAADSGASLRDSVLAVLKARRAAGDTADADAGARRPSEQPEKPAGKAEASPGAVRVADVDSLRALGPVFTPYDTPPLLQREGIEGLLRATILPVIQRHDLPPDEWARFWVLVDRKGRVIDHVLHLTSGHASFDEAAAAAAENLRYRPARRDGRRVPVWVLVRISLLMG